jgi:hypothetical protein
LTLINIYKDKKIVDIANFTTDFSTVENYIGDTFDSIFLSDWKIGVYYQNNDKLFSIGETSNVGTSEILDVQSKTNIA